MMDVLRKQHERMHACLLMHRELCNESMPQSGRLALSRLRITSANADRTRFLALEVSQVLRSCNDPDTHKLIDQLFADIAKRQAAAKEYILRWDGVAIEQDWLGYRTASSQVMTSIEQRMDMETDVLHPLFDSLPSTNTSSKSSS